MEYSDEGSFTVLLNTWVINNDLASANQLKSAVYYHLKRITKSQLASKKHNANLTIEGLPNTTSLLHDVLLHLKPPTELFESRQPFFVSLAAFVRWMLLDTMKAKQAKKRITPDQHEFNALFEETEEIEPYLAFEHALSKLETESPRVFQVALLHYFMGLDVSGISAELSLQKSTIYNELSTAKAYLRAHC